MMQEAELHITKFSWFEGRMVCWDAVKEDDFLDSNSALRLVTRQNWTIGIVGFFVHKLAQCRIEPLRIYASSVFFYLDRKESMASEACYTIIYSVDCV